MLFDNFRNVLVQKYIGVDVSDSKAPVQGKDPAVDSSDKPKSVSSWRPKTSTQRLDNILQDDLRNFGSLSSRLSTPSSVVGGELHHQRRGTNIGRGLPGSSPPTVEQDHSGRLITVGNSSEERGRATLLQQKTDMGAGVRREVESRTKVDSFLEQEQDELAMSLSQSKFLMLRNANLERVKADDRFPDVDELKQLEKIKSKFNLSNLTDTEEIPETSTDDVFQDIPDDVFDKIPRAVTARIQNRKKGSSARTPAGKLSDHPAPTAPSAPQAEGEEGEEPAQPVGFIAMLFSGGNLARPGNTESTQQIEQDFMFALFLQNKEDEGRGGNQSGRTRADQSEPDPDQGHFCAPDMPGFCEANFCIFHSKK